MKNILIFEDYPVKLCQENYTEDKKNLYNSFRKKYPELEERFEVINDELMFIISESSEISEHNWAVDFLESNVNNERPYNGLGRKLENSIYADLYLLFENEDYDGDVYFESGSDHCIVETVGKFNSRYSFRLKEDGLHWSDEEDNDEW